MAMTITMVATVIGVGIICDIVWHRYDKRIAEEEKAARLAAKKRAKETAWEAEKASKKTA